MLVIPTKALPAQEFTCVLGQQQCRMRLLARSTGLFIDLSVNDTLVIGGVVCLDRNRIVRSVYLGFVGDLAWVDVEGNDDPEYTGIGSRWFLCYFAPSELPPLVTI